MNLFILLLCLICIYVVVFKSIVNVYILYALSVWQCSV